MQSIGIEDPKSRQVYVSSLGKNLLREAFLGNNDFTQMQQSIFNPTTAQAQVLHANNLLDSVGDVTAISR